MWWCGWMCTVCTHSYKMIRLVYDYNIVFLLGFCLLSFSTISSISRFFSLCIRGTQHESTEKTEKMKVRVEKMVGRPNWVCENRIASISLYLKYRFHKNTTTESRYSCVKSQHEKRSFSKKKQYYFRIRFLTEKKISSNL